MSEEDLGGPAAEGLPDHGEAATPEPAQEPTPILPLCEDVETWVVHEYAPVYIRKITQTQRWCPSWWAHAEAIIRLTALWQTWESARAAGHPAAMAEWLHGHLDAINPVLLAADGPFSSCTPDRHHDQTPMPLVTSPPGHWNH